MNLERVNGIGGRIGIVEGIDSRPNGAEEQCFKTLADMGGGRAVAFVLEKISHCADGLGCLVDLLVELSFVFVLLDRFR